MYAGKHEGWALHCSHEVRQWNRQAELGHFLLLHDFPMLDDTVVHYFFNPLVNLSLQPDLILGIFLNFSWTITFQMFNAAAEATSTTFGI